jgi:hypothetical protein
MPERENIPGGIDVALMKGTTIIAGPLCVNLTLSQLILR